VQELAAAIAAALAEVAPPGYSFVPEGDDVRVHTPTGYGLQSLPPLHSGSPYDLVGILDQVQDEFSEETTDND
jgi:hypothetical protein